jgi:hypothetical protein
MTQSAIEAKVSNLLDIHLLSKIMTLLSLAKSGDIKGFEERLREIINTFTTKSAEVILTAAVEAAEPELYGEASVLGFGKLAKRMFTFRIFTGQLVSIPSLYARKVRRGYRGSRHLLALHWSIHKRTSPLYYSNVCALSVICPSFDITQQILDLQGVKYDGESVRRLVLHLSLYCKDKQAKFTLMPGETLVGKRVLISLDGGRTRCRQYTGRQNKAGHDTFTTNWNEPKMFVIALIDEHGKMEKKQFPIYGTMFDIDAIYDLLRSHLEGLDIVNASQVQIAGDGAVWLWNRTKSLLLDLGVAENKIVETLDYYHAMQHVYDLMKKVPEDKLQKGKFLNCVKNLLWNGKISQLVSKFKRAISSKMSDIKTELQYFTKNNNRMQYADFQANSLPVGSGIIESGIRRVINLRFKNTSSFWKQSNVEGLFFLRGILLSGRWNNMINQMVATK